MNLNGATGFKAVERTRRHETKKKKIDAWKGLPTEHDKIGTEKLSTLQLSYVHLTQCVISDVTPSTEKFIGGAKYVISM